MGSQRRVKVVGRQRWPRRAVALVAAALVAGACGGGGSGGRDESPLAQVRAMLRDRAALLATGDVDGYLAAVGPGARGLEKAIGEGAAAVPLSYANATVMPQGTRTATRFGNAVVEVVYRYEALPRENLFRFELSYDLELHDGSWTVTRSVPTGEVELPFWATGPIEVERSEHFLALHRPGLDKAAEALDAAEEARRDLGGRLELIKSDPVHLILLAGSEDEYAAIKGEPTDEGELAVAGFLFLPLSRPESRQMIVKAARLVDDSAATTFEDGERAPPKEVFQHELAHLALSRFDGPYTPSWVNEGAAMYLADERRLQSWRFGLDQGLFDEVSIEAFVGEESLADGIEYAYANAAVLYLVDTFGAEKFFEFYVRFLPLGVSDEFEQDPTGVVLAESYDLTIPELDTRTRAFMKEAVAAG